MFLSTFLFILCEKRKTVSVPGAQTFFLFLFYFLLALHDPSSQFGKKDLAKMGYYPPVCDHAKSRIRAIARYKK